VHTDAEDTLTVHTDGFGVVAALRRPARRSVLRALSAPALPAGPQAPLPRLAPPWPAP